MKTLWCRHADCDYAHLSVAGDMPRICPKCRRAAHWTTEPPTQAEQPMKPYVLWENDKRFLRALRIDPEA